MYRRKAGEEEKMKRAGGRWEGEREETRLPPFPSSHRPPRAYFSIIAILFGYPAVASAEERVKGQMIVSRHRKIDVKLLNETTEDAQDDHAVVFNT